MSVFNIFVNLANQVFGILGLSHGGTNSDLSATGGTSQVLKQSSTGAAVTVGQLAASDLSNGVSGSGAVVLVNSGALTGVPTAPTPITTDNSTTIATTAYVQAQAAVATGVDLISVNGSVVLTPISITALVNGIGAVGTITANSQALQNKFPCMVENTQINLASNPQRALATVYQNASAYPIYVQIVLVSTGASAAVFTAFSDTTATPSTVVSKNVTPNSNTTTSIAFFVLPGAFYKVTISTGSPTVFSWREFTMQAGTFTDSGDLSGSKALATVYQNTTTSLKFVVVQVSGVSTNSSVQGISDTQPSPTNVVNDATQSSAVSNTTTVFMLVPPGHYYKVTAATGSLSIWHEYTWTIPVRKSYDLALTTGQGQTRSHVAVSQTANSGGASVTTLQLQNWLNDKDTVRWVVVIAHNTTTINNLKMFAGDGIPPYLSLSFCSQNVASAKRTVFGPVAPGKVYTIFDDTAGTTTLDHWWEYCIG